MPYGGVFSTTAQEAIAMLCQATGDDDIQVVSSTTSCFVNEIASIVGCNSMPSRPVVYSPTVPDPGS